MLDKLEAVDQERIRLLASEFSRIWKEIQAIEFDIKALQDKNKRMLKALKTNRTEEELLVKELNIKYPELNGKIEIPLDFLRNF